MDALALPQPPADLTVSYGPLPPQRGDLRVPPGDGPHPTAVLLHGGCWEAVVDRGHLSGFADALRARGVATWNLEFRRVGEAGGGWPGTFDDVRAAIDALPDLAAAHGLDLSRTVLVGHSAGAHLALWYASTAARATSLRGVVALAPLTELGTDTLRGPCKRGASGLVAGADDEADLRARLSPARMPPPRAPVTLIDAAGDAVVAPIHSERYVAAHGAMIRRRTLEGCGHFELIAAGHPACDAVIDVVASVLTAP